jgi:hypothetical protein
MDRRRLPDMPGGYVIDEELLMLSSHTIAKRWRLPALLASLSLLAGLALQPVIAAKPVAPTFVDYAQCANEAPPSTDLDCLDGWINGILQASNSHYSEDQVTPQRAEVNVPAGASTDPNSHSMTFTYQARKGSAQTHAYDSLATWNWTQTEADRCDGLTGTDCVLGDASTYPIPDDTTALEPHTAPSGTNTATHMLPASTQEQCDDYATTIPSRCFEMYGGIIDSVSGYTHSCTATGDCADPSVDDYATITIFYHPAAVPAKVQLLFGGHLAVGSEGGSRTWGSGNGASDISGGPYHIKWDAADGSSIGNRDNQIMGSAIIFNDSSTSTQVWNTNGANADTQIADGGHVDIGAVVYDTATLSGTNSSTAGGTVTYYYAATPTTCATGTTIGSVAVTNGSVPASPTVTLNTAGTYEFWAFYSGDSTHGESTSSCGSETVIVNANTTTATQVKNNADDSNIANDAHVAIGTVVYDTATISGFASGAGGTVTFYYSTTAGSCAAGTQIGSPVTVTNGVLASGSATVTLNTAGTYEFWAVYSGDTGSGGGTNGSTSTCGDETVIVDQNIPAITSTPAAQIQDSATVSGLTSGATGTVTVRLFPPTNSTCSLAGTISQTTTKTLVTDLTVVGGSVSFTTQYFSVTSNGIWRYVVYYSGDGNNSAQTSGCSDETVNITITAKT